MKTLNPTSLPTAILLANLITVAAFGAQEPVVTTPTSPILQDLGKPDVIYVPTPMAVVERMLDLADVKKDDVVYDLGCGDGRIVVTAAKKYGVKAFGFDIDPVRIKEAQANAKSNRVDHLVSFQQADIFKLDLRPASVVTLYLLPDLNVKLMPQLARLTPGSRIVSHEFDMPGAKPLLIRTIKAESDFPEEEEDAFCDHTLYKWVVPWKKEEPQE